MNETRVKKRFSILRFCVYAVVRSLTRAIKRLSMLLHLIPFSVRGLAPPPAFALVTPPQLLRCDSEWSFVDENAYQLVGRENDEIFSLRYQMSKYVAHKHSGEVGRELRQPYAYVRAVKWLLRTKMTGNLAEPRTRVPGAETSCKNVNCCLLKSDLVVVCLPWSLTLDWCVGLTRNGAAKVIT